MYILCYFVVVFHDWNVYPASLQNTTMGHGWEDWDNNKKQRIHIYSFGQNKLVFCEGNAFTFMPCFCSTQTFLFFVFFWSTSGVSKILCTQPSGCPGEKTTRTVAGGPIWQSDRVIPRVFRCWVQCREEIEQVTGSKKISYARIVNSFIVSDLSLKCVYFCNIESCYVF